jgi:diadenosine tetraphosphate (Ap4A) HIT family hydrolase
MCVFCQYIHKQENYIFESEKAFVIYDNFPVNEGHCLIIPKRHVKSYFELSESEINQLTNLMFRAKDYIKNKYSPDSFNIGVNDGIEAGQTIPHCHIHLIPRYKGDIKNPRGGIRAVIPSKKEY